MKNSHILIVISLVASLLAVSFVLSAILMKKPDEAKVRLTVYDGTNEMPSWVINVTDGSRVEFSTNQSFNRIEVDIKK